MRATVLIVPIPPHYCPDCKRMVTQQPCEICVEEVLAKIRAARPLTELVAETAAVDHLAGAETR